MSLLLQMATVRSLCCALVQPPSKQPVWVWCGKAIMDVWKSLTSTDSWASCTVILCRVQNYSLVTKAVAWMVNAGIKMDREVERHLWEGQRYLPSQFLLPVSLLHGESSTWTMLSHRDITSAMCWSTVSLKTLCIWKNILKNNKGN